MGGIETRISVRVKPTLKYHPEHVDGLTPIPMKLGGGQCMLGSLTGAVSSIWGTLAVTSDVYSAVCWKLRLLVVAGPLPAVTKQCRIRRYRFSGENASGADNQQGSLRDPSTTARRASRLRVGMVIQSELLSDQELSLLSA